LIDLVLPGETFRALAFGEPSAPPLLWLHGFPDHPPTAAAFLGRLARTHRVIAPWLRGYAPSPLGGPYDLDQLASDAIAMIDALGGRVDLVGHDWGAAITYAVCARSPARVRRAVTLAVPHPRTFSRSLRTAGQLRRSWYMLLFQLPGSTTLVRARDLALIDRLWRAWSPGFTLDPASRAELHACLARSLPAPLAYYRAAARAARSAARGPATKIAAPLLQLHGADDGCIVPPTGDDERYFVERQLVVIPGAGHFLHLERPDVVASRITAWLAELA
jgi:pimeloyl-ACP methyl ester carboxylesterase